MRCAFTGNQTKTAALGSGIVFFSPPEYAVMEGSWSCSDNILFSCLKCNNIAVAVFVAVDDDDGDDHMIFKMERKKKVLLVFALIYPWPIHHSPFSTVIMIMAALIEFLQLFYPYGSNAIASATAIPIALKMKEMKHTFCSLVTQLTAIYTFFPLQLVLQTKMPQKHYSFFFFWFKCSIVNDENHQTESHCWIYLLTYESSTLIHF